MPDERDEAHCEHRQSNQDGQARQPDARADRPSHTDPERLIEFSRRIAQPCLDCPPDALVEGVADRQRDPGEGDDRDEHRSGHQREPGAESHGDGSGVVPLISERRDGHGDLVEIEREDHERRGVDEPHDEGRQSTEHHQARRGHPHPQPAKKVPRSAHGSAKGNGCAGHRSTIGRARRLR